MDFTESCIEVQVLGGWLCPSECESRKHKRKRKDFTRLFEGRLVFAKASPHFQLPLLRDAGGLAIAVPVLCQQLPVLD